MVPASSFVPAWWQVGWSVWRTLIARLCNKAYLPSLASITGTSLKTRCYPTLGSWPGADALTPNTLTALRPLTALQVQVPLTATCLAPTAAAPVLQLGYAVPSTRQVLSCGLELPLVATKFCAPVEVPPAVFTQRWQQVGGPPLKLSEQLAGVPVRGTIEALLPQLGFKLLSGADADLAVLSATCVFNFGGAGATPPHQVPCMVKMEGLGGPGCTLAVATADAAASDALLRRLAALLA